MNSHTMRGDAAENSIMQTISIAVSAILIAAGLITAPILINNARDSNARQDLANIAMGQEFVLSDKGKYTSLLTELNGADVKVTTAGSASNIKMYTGTDCYVAVTKSASNSVFYRTSASSSSVNMTKTWTAIRPAGYPVNCEWPMGFSNVNLSINPNGVSTNGWSNNNSLVHNKDYVAAPVGNPMGITTAVRTWPIAPTQYLASMYDVDGLGNTTIPRTLGYWIYVNAIGYRVPGVYGFPATTLSANTWTYVQTTAPITSWGPLYIQTIDGSDVPAGVYAYVTGANSFTE